MIKTLKYSFILNTEIAWDELMLWCGDKPYKILPFSPKMDFGVLSHKQNAGSLPSDENADGSVNQTSQACWKSHKLLKSSQPDFSPKMASDSFRRSNLWPPLPDDVQKMLSFLSSAPPPDAVASARSIAFSICQDQANAGNGGMPIFVFS